MDGWMDGWMDGNGGLSGCFLFGFIISYILSGTKKSKGHATGFSVGEPYESKKPFSLCALIRYFVPYLVEVGMKVFRLDQRYTFNAFHPNGT